MGLLDWSATPARNNVADPTIPASDSVSPRNYAGLVRSVMAGVRRYADARGGALRTGGQLNAYTVDAALGVTEIRSGIDLIVQADRTNTAQATLNVDGLGPLPWVDADGVRLAEGRIIEGRFYHVILDAEAETWRVQAGASTLDEIPGLIDLQQEVSGNAASALGAAASAQADAQTATTKAAQVETARSQVAANTAQVAANTAQVAGNAAQVATQTDQVASDRDAAQAARDQAAALVAAGSRSVATKTILDADLSPADGVLIQVTDDPDPDLRGTWRKAGPPDSGGYVPYSRDTLPSVSARTGDLGDVVGRSLVRFFSDEVADPVEVDPGGRYVSWRDAAGATSSPQTRQGEADRAFTGAAIARFFSDDPALAPRAVDAAGFAVEFTLLDGSATSPEMRAVEGRLAGLAEGAAPFFSDDPTASPLLVDPQGRYVHDAQSLDVLSGQVSQLAPLAPGAYFSDEFTGTVIVTDDGAVVDGQRVDGVHQVGLAPQRDWAAGTSGTTPTRSVYVAATGLPRLAVSTGEDTGDNHSPSLPSPGIVRWINTSGGIDVVRQINLMGGAPTLAASLAGVTQAVLVIGFGQSNMQGAANNLALTTAPPAPGRVLMFDNGSPRLLRSGQGPGRQNDRVQDYMLDRLVDAREELFDSSGECPMTQLGFELQKRLGPSTVVIVANVAVGSQPYEALIPGTAPGDNALAVMRRVRILMGVLGLPLKICMAWSGQEAHIGNNFADSFARLTDMQGVRFGPRTQAILSNSVEMLVSLDQIANFTAYGLATAEMPLAQLQAGVQQPAKFVTACPSYLFPTMPDKVHATASGQAHKGALHGRALARAILGQDARPLYPTGATVSGSRATITCNVPTGPLNLGSPIVSDPGNRGVVAVRQDNGVAVPVSAVAASGSNVLVDVTSPPAGVPLWIGFGTHGTPGAAAGPTTGARCTICDSSPDTTAYGLSMANHMAISRVAATF